MSRCAAAVLLAALLLVPGLASARERAAQQPLPRALWAAPPIPSGDDSEEPTSPSGKKPAATPAPTPAATPAGAEPGGKPGEEPTRPGAAATGEPTTAAKVKPKRDVLYGAGINLRGIFVPNWFLSAFVKHSTPLNSFTLGGEFVRRKGNFDLVAALNFGFYSPPDGNWMGKNKSYADDVDYLQFRNLNVLSFEVAFIWHHDFLKWLSLVYGAGLGLGVVLGDIYRISSSGCDANNITDVNQCHPLGQDPKSPGTWPAGTGADTPGSPHFYREDGVWPVVPIIHLLIGLNFKINEQISIRLDGGFHDAFYVGIGSHYFF